MVFDSWVNFEKPQLQKLFEIAGSPKNLVKDFYKRFAYLNQKK